MSERYILIVKCDRKRKGTSSLLYKDIINTLVDNGKEFHYRIVNGWKGFQIETAFIVMGDSARWKLSYDLDIPLEDFQRHTTDVPLFS